MVFNLRFIYEGLEPPAACVTPGSHCKGLSAFRIFLQDHTPGCSRRINSRPLYLSPFSLLLLMDENLTPRPLPSPFPWGMGEQPHWGSC